MSDAPLLNSSVPRAVMANPYPFSVLRIIAGSCLATREALR